MQKGLSAYARSPAALACTLLAGVAIGALVAAAGLLAATVRATGIADNPLFLGGLGHLAYLGLGVVVLAVAWVVWLPFGAGIAYAVGRRVRGERATIGETVAAVVDAGELLYRWTRTRTAVGPLAGRVLGDDDVAPVEVAVGCTGYVVPAGVLDANTMQQAVERANRVTPQPGRERLQVAGLALTALVALATVSVVSTADIGFAVETASLGRALAVVVVGCVLTAAVDTAWRADVYASQDLSEGFLR